MFETIGGILTSILGGGVTGILGVVVQRYWDFRNKSLDLQIEAQKFQHELDLRKVDAEIQAEEFATRTQVAQIEATAQVETADAQAFAASFNDPKPYSAAVVPSRGQGWALVGLDMLRGCVRPVLTLYLCTLMTMIYFNAHAVLKSVQLKPEQALETANYVIQTVLYLTTTCVLHWWGTRNKSPAPKLR